MPPTTKLGWLIRRARLTYYHRMADRLEAAVADLDYDPEVIRDGEYVCFAGRRVRFQEAFRWVNPPDKR